MTQDEDTPRIDQSYTRKVKDISAGFAGGAVQVLIGQPFDLVKVRMQTGQHHSPFAIISETLKNEGLSAFYKGTLAPLFGVGACVSIQFYGYYEARRQILKYRPTQKDLTLPQFYVAGAFAGIVNTPVTAPVEQIRILLQLQTDNNNKLYKGPKEAVQKIIRDAGLWSGIYRGTVITLLREAQAYGMWFLSYEYMMREAMKIQHKERKDISTPWLLLFGAAAGDVLWLSSYPLDVIKSRLQGDPFGQQSKYNGKIGAVVNDIVAREGWRGFWRGIGPTLVRAIPCSAATFTTVEYVLRLLG
ncbi:DEKNAAC100225 [Brettanomyces naardenensis]|uniref:DEKNAAC100225 n=1 Tax=Brettanomyces naardenensis TaxID=13370 RepID=A0A448YFV3_BRENA|nr:DEKNAAC100225 [Brettanomyces naardenensis]